MTAPLLALADVSVVIAGRTIVDRVSLAVNSGELVAVIGPNGAGKTTLLRAAAGLIPARGAVSLSGEPLASLKGPERARRLAYLPQGNAVHWPLPVVDVVALGRLPQSRGADRSRADAIAVERAMAATGIAEYADRAVTTLSGGERSRVALARVLATEAPLILADEPTASLDPRYQLEALATLRRHVSAGGAVVAVLHDLTLAARADRVVLMDRGRVIADGVPRIVLSSPEIARAFGVAIETIEVHGLPVAVPMAATP